MLIPSVLIAAAYFFVPILLPMWQGLEKENYRGVPVASGLGLAFIFPTVLALIFHLPHQKHAPVFLATILVFTLLGLLDDFLGNGAKGFRGHFAPGRISTGALKAVGGVFTAGAVSYLIASSWWQLLIDALLITLGANFLNLLDLRPGRAGKGFVFFSLVLLPLARGTVAPLLWLTGAVLGYLPWDLKEKAMMGDAGSNALGAALGLAAALVLPRFAKIIVAAVLVALNLLAEKVSFSGMIANNRILNFLDRLGR